jgi:MFS superfamily sulfate permease-like transporter
MRRLYRVKRSDFWIAMAALLGVLGAGVMAGVVIGIVLSMVWLVYVSAVPAMPVLGLQPDTRVFRSVQTFPDGRTYPGVLVLGFDAGLFFIDADALQDRIRQEAQAARPPLTLVVVDFEGVNYIDSQGSDAVDRIRDLAQSHGAELRLARVKPAILEVLAADGVVDRLGDGGITSTVYDAVADRVATRHGGNGSG